MSKKDKEHHRKAVLGKRRTDQRVYFPVDAGTPTGELSDECRQQLEDELAARNIRQELVIPFLHALDEAAASYHGQKEAAQDNSPAIIRDNLGKAIQAAEKLESALDALDNNSRALLKEVVETGYRAVFAHAMHITTWLEKASRLAEEYPKRGRVTDYARQFLACEIAIAISDHLDTPPTTTKEGLYMAVLSIVLADVTGKPVSEVHELARKGLNAFNSSNPN